MAQLRRQVLGIALSEGLAENVSVFSTEPGKLLVGENIRFNREGAVEKRKGHTLAFNTKSGAVLNQGEGRLVAAGKELLLLDGKDVVSYAPGSTAQKVCVAPPFSASTLGLAGATSPGSLTESHLNTIQQAIAVYDTGTVKYLLAAWLVSNDGDQGDVYAQLYEYETLSPVTTAGLISGLVSGGTSNSHCLHCFAVGAKLHVVWGDHDTTRNIKSRILDASTLNWGATVNLATDVTDIGGVNVPFSAQPLSGTTYGVAYIRVADSKIRAMLWDQADSSSTTISLTDAPAHPPAYMPYGLGIFGNTSKVYVSYGYDPNDGLGIAFKCSRIDYATWVEELSSTLARAPAKGANGEAVLCSTGYYDSGSSKAYLAYCYMRYNSTGFPPAQPWELTASIYKATIDSVGGVTNAATLHNARLTTHMFAQNSRYYVGAQRDTGEWAGATWADVGDAVDFGGYNGYNRATPVVLDVQYDSVKRPVEVCVVYPAQSTITDGPIVFRPALHTPVDLTFCVAVAGAQKGQKVVRLVKLSTDDAYRWQAAQTEDGPILGGGLVAAYDRFSLYPINFPLEPAWSRIGETGIALGAGWDNTKKFFIQVCYERTDALGRVGRSAPDYGCRKGTTGGSTTLGRDGIQETTNFTPSAATSDAFIYYPKAADGWDDYVPKGRVANVLYTNYTAGDDASLKRYNGQALDTLGGSYNVNFSNLQLSGPPYPDRDAQLPYTLGGASLPNLQPPCLIAMVVFDGRLWGIDHTRRQLWFSKSLVPGEVPGWAADFTIPTPFDATALAVMDGNLIVFGEERIGAVTGTGPSESGAGLGYSQVQFVATDHGCIEPRSVVVTPVGCIYQAPNGLALLDRGLNTRYIGRAVMDTLASYPTITSAIVHPQETVVLITCVTDGPDVGSSPDTGARLVYDYRLDRWSVDYILGGKAILSQVVCDSKVYILTHDGAVYVEDRATGLDAGSWVTMRIKLAPVRVGGILGYQRVWRVAIVGESLSSHNLAVKTYSDDRAASDQTRTYSNTTTSLTSPELVQLRLKRQLCHSLSVEVSDASPSSGSVGVGYGPRVGGITLELAVESDLARTPANRRS